MSPLIGSSYLHHIDAGLSNHKKNDIVYERVMDDFLVLSLKRWPLKTGYWAIKWLPVG
ncbi:hypothetical protein AAHD08_003373 [Providencia rettgeri]